MLGLSRFDSRFLFVILMNGLLGMSVLSLISLKVLFKFIQAMFTFIRRVLSASPN